MAIKINNITVIDDSRQLSASGINTLGNVVISSGIITASSSSGIVTYYGDGSRLINISASQWVSTAAGIHTLSNVGIGTTNPQTKLEIGGVLGFGANSNVRIGDNTTGLRLTTGNNNFFAGIGAGSSTTTGSNNNFIGNFAGYYNVNGTANNFIGNFAGYSNTNGLTNNFFGGYAGYYNTTGNYNNFFGNGAGYYNTTGYSNNFFGPSGGYYNTTGTHNVFLGSYTGISTSSSFKILIGNSNSGYFDAPDTTKDTQFAVGVKTSTTSKYWLVGNENFNIGIGTTNPQTKLEINGILGFSTDANNRNNIRIGSKTTGASVTPNNPNTGNGLNNIFIGVGAGSSTTYGAQNNFFGRYSGHYNTSGFDNNFFGVFAGFYNTSGSNNNFFGYFAGYYNTTGDFNTFIGERAGYSNIIGVRNNFIGYGAGYYNTEGNRNNFVGFYGGYKNATGNYNNFVGNYSGISTSASRKVILGSGYNYSNLFDSPDTTKDTQFAVGIRTDANPSKYWLVGNENFNIGIGTTNPQYKLDVGGDINFTGTFYQNGSPFVASRWSTGTGNDIYRLNGNVGIGTTNPTSKLTVTGDTLISGILTARNAEVQDSISLNGRAGGTSSFNLSLTPTTLAASRTVTFQDVSGTVYVSGGTDVTLADGGTNASLTASNGGIVYSTASAMAILSGTATAGQILRSGASGAPSWSTATFPSTATTVGTILRADGTNWVATTATYPTTTTANQILYSSANNTIGEITSANTSALVTNSSGVPSFTSGTTANRLLKTTGTTISFAQADLTTDVTGILPATNGGTAQSTYTTGDILYASATNTLSKLPVGTASSVLTVSGGVPVWSASTIAISDDTATNATRYVTFTPSTSGSVGVVSVSSSKLTFNPSTGNLSATQFTSLSDITQKTNVKRIENSIELTKQLQGVRFNWIDNNKPSLGLIAQDVEKVLPELVETGEDGLKRVNYSNMIGLLIETIKEQQVRIEELEKKINA